MLTHGTSLFITVTDGQTDRWTTYDSNTVLMLSLLASRGKNGNKIYKLRFMNKNYTVRVSLLTELPKKSDFTILSG